MVTPRHSENKTTRRIYIGTWSDHKKIECKLNVTVLAAKTAGNSPVINYAAQGGWDRYNDISNKKAPDVVNLIDEDPSIHLRQTGELVATPEGENSFPLSYLKDFYKKCS